MSGYRTGPHDVIIAATRRSWTKAQKLAIVAEVGVGGATLSEVARRHGIHSSLLFRWRRARSDEAPSAEPIDTKEPTRPALTFMPIVVPATSSPPASNIAQSSAPKSVSSSTVFEIVLAGGRVLRVGADVDTTALVRIVAALEMSR